MCAVQLLRVSVHQRISAAAEDFLLRVEEGGEAARVPPLRALLTERLAASIVAVLEETVAEYEHRAERSEREICRQRRLLDAVMKPEVRLQRADFQQVMLSKAEVPPEQQQWSPLVDQEDPEPPHIKEEQKEIRISQEGEQLQALEEADIIKFTFTPVAVKREEDEETPQSSQLHQSPTEESRASCGGPEPEPARNSGPDGHFQPGPENRTSNCFEPVAEHRGGDWRKTRESPSCFNTRINKLSCNTLPTVRLPQGLERILANVGYVNGELLYRLPAAPPLVAAAPQAKPLIPQKRRRVNPLDDSRPYIKKPPNAFMLFRKEERLKVVAELHNANSAAVNTIIGQRMITNCPFCGSNLNSATKFCRRCGSKIRLLFDASEAATGQAGTTGRGALASSQRSREKEAKFCFTKKSERKKKEPPKENLVKTSVGIMEMSSGWLRAVRGMVLPLVVRSGADAEELLKAAQQKMKDFNTADEVLHEGPYVLLYADGTKIINIPGTETAFSLKLYKQAVKKSYQRITVYLCTAKDHSEHLRNPRIPGRW